jgi:hypothetical protein
VEKHLLPLWLVAHDHMHAAMIFFPQFCDVATLVINDMGEWHLAIPILDLYTSIP